MSCPHLAHFRLPTRLPLLFLALFAVAGALSPMTGAATSAAGGSSGLVAAFAFDATSGSAAVDASGTGNGGVLSNATWTTAGKYGGALSFNGTSSSVTVADGASLDLSNGLTLEAWVYPTASVIGSAAIVAKDRAGGGLPYGIETSRGVLDAYANNGSSAVASDVAALPLNTWSYVSSSYDGTTLRAFVDGVEVSSTPMSGSLLASNDPLRIGADLTWGEYFTGRIDNVRVYNRALPASEVLSDMSTAIAPPPPPPPPPAPQGPVAAYSFAEGIGSTSADSSGNGRTAVLAPAQEWSLLGKFGNAVYLDGISNYVSTSDAPQLDLSTSLTLEAWVYPKESLTGSRTVIAKERAGGGFPYGIELVDGVPSAYINTGTTAQRVDGTAAIPLLAWTHLTATYDGSMIRLYVDGALAGSTAATGTLVASADPLRLGGTAVWGEFFLGRLDEVRIYNRALSAAQVVADMNAAVTVAVPDTQAPSVPADLAKTGATQTSVSLSWTASTDNVGVAGYGAYRGTLPGQNAAPASSTVSALACGTSYTFAVDAYDAAANRSAKSASVSASTNACDTQAPTAPSGVVKTGSTATSISVSWTGSTDNVAVTGYGVYRDTTLSGSTAGTSYMVTGLTCGLSYFISVDAHDAATNRSAKSAAVTASTSACPVVDTQAPTAPTGIVKTGSTESTIAVSWTAATDNVGVSGYGIYRDGLSISTTGGTTFSYSGLACGSSYTLGIDAYDVAGNRSGTTSLTTATAACTGGTGASVFISPSGSDSSPCTQSAPCRSFDRAYHVASPGQIVQMAGGSYGDQTLLYDASKTSQTDVIFQEASGAAVTVGQLEFGPDRFTRGASHVTVKDITVTNDVQILGCGTGDSTPCPPETSSGGDDITLQNLRVKGAYAFYCASCSDVNILGGVWGPDTYQCRSGLGSAHPEVQNSYLQQKRSHGILIDGATFQNFARCSGADHTECLQVEPADDVTIRNSTFMRCDTIVVNFANDLSFGANSPAGYTAPNNILLENNFFDVSMDNTGGPTYYSVNIRECTNCTIRYNSWLQAPRMPNGQISLNNKYIGNVGPQSDANCGVGGITWAYNVWEGAKCGATDKNVANVGFVNRGAMNLHLAPGSPAINAGDPNFYPARDIDGQLRPLGGTPDAGADEAG